MSSTQKGPFEVISTREVYKNPWIRVREDQVNRPDGNPGLFGVIEMQPGSTVLAIDADHNAFLVEEYKYGIEQESLELMSGGIDGKEAPLDGAKRELREELGLEADEWVDLGVVNPFTTIVCSPNYMFLAMGLHEVTQKRDAGEVLRKVTMPFDEAVDMVMEGRITHAASCVLILKAAKYLAICKRAA